ncbi:hypothetical protein RUM43_001325 [Polyplax serrata]|uniref:Uncharacterized protein n=1 Tax=Polyplax serrata TaxID=468196 RepID=A0AAN8SF66_POLSC
MSVSAESCDGCLDIQYRIKASFTVLRNSVACVQAGENDYKKGRNEPDSRTLGGKGVMGGAPSIIPLVDEEEKDRGVLVNEKLETNGPEHPQFLEGTSKVQEAVRRDGNPLKSPKRQEK